MQQTSGNVFSGHLGQQGSTRSRECSQIPFRILVDDQSKLCVTSTMELFVTKNSIVCRRVSTPPHLKIIPPHFLKPVIHPPPPPPPPPPTLLTNLSSQVFLINRNATVKLTSVNTIHVKQQCWLFHFQVHSKVHGR